MENDAVTRHAAAAELHAAAVRCLDAMRTRLGSGAVAEGSALALGIEMRASAPTLLLMARAPEEMLPLEVLRIGAPDFGPDEVRLASVAGAVANLLLQDIDGQLRRQVIGLVKSGNGHLSLYVVPEPFAAALELHAGIEVTELARIANQPADTTLQ